MAEDNKSSSPKLVRDLMSVGVLTCSPDTAVIELTRVLLEKDLEGAVVLDDQGHATGAVTRDDLVRAYARGEYEMLTAEEVMQDGVQQLPPDIPLTAAAQIMQDRGVRIVFLMHNAGGISYPAAMLSFTHLLRHLAMEDTVDLHDLGIKASREAPLESFFKRRNEALRRIESDGRRVEE
jgi:predicted transcriptional regulator